MHGMTLYMWLLLVMSREEVRNSGCVENMEKEILHKLFKK